MIKPLGSRLLIETVKVEQPKTLSGIHLVDEVAPQSLKAKVLAVGPEVKDFKVGDIILCAQYAPTQAKEIVTDKTLVVPAEDVLAVIVPDKTK